MIEADYIVSRWLLIQSENKTPKYYLESNIHESPLFDQRGRDGRVCLYLHDSNKRNEEHKEQTPQKFLQGKNGINITGLKFVNGNFGDLVAGYIDSAFAYGEASQKQIVTGGRQNYMYPHKADAYLFKFGGLTDTPKGLLPSFFYFIILPNCRNFAQTICTDWANGRKAYLNWIISGLEAADNDGRVEVCI